MKESVINIGYILLPKFLDDLLEVVLSHEIGIPFQTENQNSINSWRMMVRHASSYIEENEKENIQNDLGITELFNAKKDEKFEIGLFDLPNRFEKKIGALQKVRKVYAKEPIIVKVYVKNPLMADVEISKIFLKCKFVGKEEEKNEDSLIENMMKSEGPDFEISDQSVILSPSSVKEIILEVVPMKEGEIFILGIEWELFNAVS